MVKEEYKRAILDMLADHIISEGYEIDFVENKHGFESFFEVTSKSAKIYVKASVDVENMKIYK